MKISAPTSLSLLLIVGLGALAAGCNEADAKPGAKATDTKPASAGDVGKATPKAQSGTASCKEIAEHMAKLMESDAKERSSLEAECASLKTTTKTCVMAAKTDTAVFECLLDEK